MKRRETIDEVGAATVARAAMGVSAGLQAMVAALVLWGPIDRSAILPTLTRYGQSLTRPERDLPIYLLGVALSIALGVGTAAVTRARWMAWPSLIGCCVATVGGWAWFAALLIGHFPVDGVTHVREPLNPADPFLLFAPALAVAGLAIGGAIRARRRAGPGEAVAASETVAPVTQTPPAQDADGPASPWVDWIFSAAIVLAVAIPPWLWTKAAGDNYRADALHHWSFFVMGPALHFLRGQSFYADFYSQYGMGWPLLMATLLGNGLRFSTSLGLASIFGCIYYVGLFWFARALTRGSTTWAMVATLLGISWQLFGGVQPGTFQWCYPSSTLLRDPADVWFFFALLAHWRGGKAWTAMVAGLLCGLGLAFETDTGLYLVGTFFCYLLARAASKKAGVTLASIGFLTAASGAFFAVALAANHGAVPGGLFWRRWAEALGTYAGSGVSLLPIAGVGDGPLLAFVFMVATYVGIIVYAIARVIAGDPDDDASFVACVGAYGLALLLLFVGRSHPDNLYHPAVPFAVVVAWIAWRGFRAARQREWFATTVLQRPAFLSGATAAAVALLLVTGRTFGDYPHLWSAPASANRAAIVPGDVEIADPTDDDMQTAAERNAAYSLLRLTGDAPDNAAVLDYEEATLDEATGKRPWNRYCPLFPMLFTRVAAEEAIRELVARGPEFVLIRSRPWPVVFDDIWREFHAVTEARYRLVRVAGPFELWRRAPGAGDRP